MFAALSNSPVGLNSVGVLLSETASILNGAHLNSTAGLSGLFRRYHHTAGSGGPESDGVKDQAPPTLSSVLISELGLNGLSDYQWKQVVNGVWSQLDVAETSGGKQSGHVSVQDILKQCKGPLKACHLWQPVRKFSSLARVRSPFRKFGFDSPVSERFVCVPSTSLLGQRGYATLIQLEERANDEYDNAPAQARYMEAVLESDPEYVIRRFESGKYAVNPDVRELYLKAIDLAEKPRQERRSSSVFSFPLQSSQQGGVAGVGSRDNPFHVVPLPRKGEMFRQLWYLLRFLIVIAIILSFFSSSIVTSVKSGTQQMTKDFRPDPMDKPYSFDDVQGVEEAKAELQEVVEFLKNPEKFQRLGAKLPTGLLLIGPPGTGKTLLGKAIAGEAQVPFFFASGSEFDEMFVGVGAARVRKLFEQARRHKPCVVFIDELDAVGGARIASSVHPYSRMTLNQLLVEMDGYNELEGVVIIGATNFPESLDKALIRPGRFDSQIIIPLPDVKARFEILKVHAKKVIMSKEVDLELIARGTSGFTGADLANLINQAALHGSAAGVEAVSNNDLDYARDKLIMGTERRSAVIEEKNRIIVAFHEGGHAIVALYTPEALPIHKATIMPRGQALGMVSQLSEKDELSWSKKQLMARMDVAMGGRVAEELVFGPDNITSGASSDLESATRIAKAMVTKFGMTDLIGPVAHDDKSSSFTQKLIDNEVKRLLKESYERASNILKAYSVEHKRLADALLKHETLSAEEIKSVVAAKPLKRKL